MGYEEFYRAREIVVDILRKDLVGPVEEDEIIEGFPTSYYVMGKLYPQKSTSEDVEQQEEGFLEGSEEPLDSPVSLSNQFEPSSMGLTFAVWGKTEVHVQIKYATYEEIEATPAKHEAGDKSLQYRRCHHSHELVTSCEPGMRQFKAGSHAEVWILVRKPSTDGSSAVTVSLLNSTQSVRSGLKNASNTLFQPSIRVTLDDAGEFTDIDWRKKLSRDKELAELELLYRKSGCFAQGHGCSVEWDLAHESPQWVSTAIIPQCDIPQMMPRQSNGLDVFGMSFLVDAERTDVVNQLHCFVGEYADWIEGIDAKIIKLAPQYVEAAKRNVAQCRHTKERLSSAVELLAEDEEVFRAFRLANKAMLLQWERSCIKRGQPFNRKAVAWYPFQLAFILQELRSIADPHCEDRAIADLLWFPTGGGKTEAYLGIAAFCIFLRRIRDTSASGVTVIMRYTLRLLTIQQFERASTMVAACEQVRLQEHLGGEEISIGLWVGRKLDSKQH